MALSASTYSQVVENAQKHVNRATSSREIAENALATSYNGHGTHLANRKINQNPIKCLSIRTIGSSITIYAR